MKTLKNINNNAKIEKNNINTGIKIQNAVSIATINDKNIGKNYLPTDKP